MVEEATQELIQKVVQTGLPEGEVDGHSFALQLSEKDGEPHVVAIDDVFYQVDPDNPSEILEMESPSESSKPPKRKDKKKAKPKKKKEPKPTTEERVCEGCGEKFEVSKFNPYFTECKKCRHGNFSQKSDASVEKKCEKCGNAFQISKFNPYISICPDCRTKAKKEQKAKTKVEAEDQPDTEE